ncbi:hypothetical protein [Malikia sp.]|uniref:hypothetical protein n=1 Tax=Malikia sp. TaxID=2070706 RepID=UPI00261DBCFB|nr:hypothetical protein [Malikia sp.]MDD2728282.1 hypothetical protein [Malikia sp.]
MPTENLDQQLHKIQSARDHLQQTKQLFDEFGSLDLKISGTNKFTKLLDALNWDLAEAERKKIQQQVATLTEQKQRLEGEMAEAQAEIKRLRQQNEQRNGAQQTEQTQQLQRQIDEIQQAKSRVESALQNEQRNAAQKTEQAQQLQRQIDEIQQAKSRVESALQNEQRNAAQKTEQAQQLQRQIKESQQENELLLQQLHQVQEELEQYFLDKQKLERECETLQQRWERLERRQPGYLDYELIEPVAVDTVSDLPRIEWRIANITVMGRLQPELTFGTLLKDGQAGIALDGIELFPRALRGPDAAKAIEQFRRFGRRQWGAVLAAASALEQFFAGEATVAPSLSFDPVFWRQVLLPLVAELRALPSVFRFDDVTLKRELVNPDYEHLWLVLEGASLGQKQWPRFELRLGAADVRPGRFSRHPKLEFPLIDGKTRPFDSWYEESHDDFGGKFELRFDIDRKLMDLGVWSKLSVDDRKLLLSVNGLLGQALQRLQTAQCPISRAWSDWQGLATGIIETLQKLSETGARQKIQAQPVAAPAAAVSPAQEEIVVKEVVVKEPEVKEITVEEVAVKKTVVRKTAAKKVAAKKTAPGRQSTVLPPEVS